jgi:hypothetical protein
MGSITWDRDVAEVYDATYKATFEPSVLDPIVDRLVDLAQGGPALEFAAGTGRVTLPQLRSIRRGEIGRVFTLDADHVGIETFDDLVEQIVWSHHWIEVEGRLVRHAAPYRYVWPSELDLMARIAGFRLQDRWAGWHRAPFTSDSTTQVAVFEKVS